jgi:hypothetical protein
MLTFASTNTLVDPYGRDKPSEPTVKMERFFSNSVTDHSSRYCSKSFNKLQVPFDTDTAYPKDAQYLAKPITRRHAATIERDETEVARYAKHIEGGTIKTIRLIRPADDVPLNLNLKLYAADGDKAAV